MTIREQTRKGRRPRRKNGDARSNVPWTVKGVEYLTRLRISALALSLNTTAANVIDMATKQFAGSLNNEDKEKTGKGNTLSPVAEMYASLLVKDDKPSDDLVAPEPNISIEECREVRQGHLSNNTQATPPEVVKRLGLVLCI